MFYIKQEDNVSVSIEMVDGNIVLRLNDLEIGYFEKDGLHLLPECSYEGKIPASLIDDRGYIRIIKP